MTILVTLLHLYSWYHFSDIRCTFATDCIESVLVHVTHEFWDSFVPVRPGSESIQSHILRRPGVTMCNILYSQWVTSSVSRRHYIMRWSPIGLLLHFPCVYISNWASSVEIVGLCMESSLAIFPPDPSMYLCFRLKLKRYHWHYLCQQYHQWRLHHLLFCLIRCRQCLHPHLHLRRSRRTLHILQGDIPLGRIRTEILGDHWDIIVLSCWVFRNMLMFLFLLFDVRWGFIILIYYLSHEYSGRQAVGCIVSHVMAEVALYLL